jgi:catechol 2,3-dioxygenase-like lactoylglutathione lyase family enzyme
VGATILRPDTTLRDVAGLPSPSVASDSAAVSVEPRVHAVLDHIAIAAEHTIDNFARYRGDLGAAWVAGMYDPGFYWGQLRFANGMTIELLEPADIAQDDFLRRFLDRSGPGPHHVTFKVADIEQAIDAVTAGGYPPVRMNTMNPSWKEAFLHPKQSHGIVVQLAQSIEFDHAPQFELPPPKIARPASLERIVHLVADLGAAVELFEHILGGARGQATADSVDLMWPGGGRICLVEPHDPELLAWLGTRPGRVHHLEIALDDPAAVPGAVAIAEGAWEIPPEQNLGVRLRLHTNR